MQTQASAHLKARQLEFFRAVMRAGGASSAARLLGTSQSLVSHQIAALEAVLGFRLFERKRARLIPTRQGEMFYREVERHYVSLEQVERRAHHLRNAQENQVYVGCQQALAHTLLADTIHEFRQSHPEVRVSLQVANSGDIKDHVANGDWDVGFAASEVDTAGTVHSVFSRTRGVLITPPRHPLARAKGPVSLAQLASHQLVALNPEDVARRALEQACEAAAIRPQIAVETPYSTGVLALVSAGVGVGIMNPLSLSPELSHRVEIRQLAFDIEFSTVILFPPEGPKSELAREIVRIARTRLRSHQKGPASPPRRRRTGGEAPG